ncbi:hypothetical protein CSAL01_07402 [Colletotrichum salicis]|uniref:Uncharacterized protein n=1 Tax=Colletotrichum salicis TaxID=1209931 RepID=A0A135RVG7_9PEZI|nr:hypothetical protein CSAL01_07402 [Colletotrichum salicis]
MAELMPNPVEMLDRNFSFDMILPRRTPSASTPATLNFFIFGKQSFDATCFRDEVVVFDTLNEMNRDIMLLTHFRTDFEVLVKYCADQSKQISRNVESVESHTPSTSFEQARVIAKSSEDAFQDFSSTTLADRKAIIIRALDLIQ